MQVMILCAGRGIRLRPLTDNTPKPLIKVGGKSLLARHLQRLQQCGFDNIIINTCHLGEKIKDAIKDGAMFATRVRYSEENPALETAGGIQQAITRQLLSNDKPFLCINGDILCDIDFSTINIPPNADCHLVMVDNPPQHPSGDFSLSEKNLLLPPQYNTLTFSGIGIYRPHLFNAIVSGTAAKLSPIIQAAIHRKKATGQKHSGMWHDTGVIESLSAARAVVFNGDDDD